MAEILSKIDKYLDKLKEYNNINKESYLESDQDVNELLIKICDFIINTPVLNEETVKRRDYFSNLSKDEEFIDVIYSLNDFIVEILTVNKYEKIKNEDELNDELKYVIDYCTEGLKKTEKEDYLKNEALSIFERLMDLNYISKENSYNIFRDIKIIMDNIWLRASCHSLPPPPYNIIGFTIRHFYKHLYLNNTQDENEEENENFLSLDNKLFFITHMEFTSYYLTWEKINSLLNDGKERELFDYYSNEFKFFKELNIRGLLNIKDSCYPIETITYDEYMDIEKYNLFLKKLEEIIINKPTLLSVNQFKKFSQLLNTLDNCHKKITISKKVLEELKDFYLKEQNTKSNINQQVVSSPENLTRYGVNKIAETCGYVLYEDGSLLYKQNIPDKPNIPEYLITLCKECMDRNNSSDKIIDYTTVNDELEYKTGTKDVEKAKDNAAKKISILRIAFKKLSNNQKHNPFKPRSRGESAWKISII